MNGKKFIDKISYKEIILFSLLIHLVIAWFSKGFHQFDEHFQILEFLNFKWGQTPESELAWEYHQKIRPWFQVLLYYGFLYPFKVLGLKNPFVLEWLIRFFTSLIHIASLVSLVPILKEFYQNKEKVKEAFLFLNFLWFVPYFHVRASAESLGAAFLTFGFSYFLQSLWKKKEASNLLTFLGGVALGLSYLCKNQLAISVMFFWFWALFFKRKENTWNISLTAMAIALVILLGPVIDFWGYGEWTFSPWNYFHVNIIENRASGFGTDPWWYYFSKIFLKGIPPISFYFIVAGFYFLFKKRKNPITWVVVPFLLIHIYIPHKELRFLFPMIPFLCLMIFSLREEVPKLFPKMWFRFCLSLNAILLFITLFKPAHSAIALYQTIYSKDLKEILYEGESPYSMVGLNIFYYRPENFSLNPLKEQTSGIIFRRSYSGFQDSVSRGCEVLFSTYPLWLIQYNYFNWVKRSRIWSLAHCKVTQ